MAKLLPIIGECYYGERGLDRVSANWQLIMPTEGAIIVSILTNKYEKYLPIRWQGMHIGKMTKKTAPFVEELKYVDIIVRPGTGLWVPTHWFVEWTAKDAGVQPLVCVANLHNPISFLMSRGK